MLVVRGVCRWGIFGLSLFLEGEGSVPWAEKVFVFWGWTLGREGRGCVDMSPLAPIFRFICVVWVLGGALVCDGAVQCARLFTDHMVLQRDRLVPVWGSAAPGEHVTVSFAGQRKTVETGSDGAWRVMLDPMAACATPGVLSVQGENSIEFSDVVVGEVWFCSGQSNMEKPLGPRKGQRPTDDFELEIAAASYPSLRLFQVPRTDLKQEGPGLFRWLPCSPEALRSADFSAAAYYFGRQLSQTLGVPVGLIHASFGGTRIEAWLPAEGFAEPALRGLEKEKYQAWVPGVQATELFRSMVAPYAPYGVRGFLWYQGEANCMLPDTLYATKLSTLISQWRRVWETPDAPFLGVLLAPFDYSKWDKFPVTSEALPLFWEGQVKALSALHTGYIVTTDLVSDLHDIHPTNKRDVGHRLARLALAEVYGRADIRARGPSLAGLKQNEGALELSFLHAEGLRTRDGLAPSDFSVAGADRIFHPATAKIEKDKVVLRSSEVPAPVAARFGWRETATPNLVNGSGLPAVPFRTDDWPVSVARQPQSTGNSR